MVRSRSAVQVRATAQEVQENTAALLSAASARELVCNQFPVFLEQIEFYKYAIR